MNYIKKNCIVITITFITTIIRSIKKFLLGAALRYHQQLWPSQKTEWDGVVDKNADDNDDDGDDDDYKDIYLNDDDDEEDNDR